MRSLRGDKRDYAPISPISFSFKFSELVAKLIRLIRGDNRE